MPRCPQESACAEGPFDFRRAARVVRQLAEALAYAHSQGIVHRDVKPANVMLNGKDEPLLADLGLAARQESEEKLTQDGSVLDTWRPSKRVGRRASRCPPAINTAWV